MIKSTLKGAEMKSPITRRKAKVKSPKRYEFESKPRDIEIKIPTSLEILEKQKDVTSRLLKKLKSFGLETICAGGFPRDYLIAQENVWGQCARDMDIYIKYDEKTFSQQIQKIKHLGLDNLNKGTGSNYPEAGINGIKHVYGARFSEKGAYHKFDLIFVDTKKDLDTYVFSEFDFSICKAIFDGEEFRTSPEFDSTMKTGVITITKGLPELAVNHSLKKHLGKLLRKFKDKLTFDLSNVTIPKGASYYGLKRVKITGVSKAFYKKEDKYIETKTDFFIKDELADRWRTFGRYYE